MAKSKRGRPPKARPASLSECTSLRQISMVTGVDRKFLGRAKLIADMIPHDEFDQIVESENFAIRDLDLLARRRANKKTDYERRCPHCGYLLRLEDAG